MKEKEEKKISMHDVMRWLEQVGSDVVLQELEILVKARLIDLKYFANDSWD